VRKNAFFFVAVILCAAVKPLQAVHYWLVPSQFSTIQAAIDSNDCNDGDFVIVFDNIYDGNEGFYDIDFRGKAITVQSSGGAEDCIIKCPPGYQAFRFQNGEDANSVVDGFTIENAQVSGSGGAFSCLSSSPTIKNCVIKNNSADYGAGIYCQSSSPTIINCSITGNSAIESGGAVYADSSCSLTIIDCNIIGNSAQSTDESYGGAIYCKSSSLDINSCEISKNWAQSDYSCYGGAFYITQSSNVTIANSTIGDNWAVSNYEQSYGGAVHCQLAVLSISDSTIFNNSADYGGAVNCYQTNFDIVRCTISSNSSVGAGGGLNLQTESAGTIAHCMIVGNSGSIGGGIECDGQSSPVIKNCLISGNEAYYYTGGGIDCYGSSPSVINCTISSNQSPLDVGGGVNCEADTGHLEPVASRPLITNCIFENNSKYAVYELDEYSDPCLTYCLFYNNIPDQSGTYGDYWDSDTASSYTGVSDSNDSINNIPDGFAYGNIGDDPRFVMNAPCQTAGTWAIAPNEPVYNSSTKRTLLTDTTADFDVDALVGKFINTNTNQKLQAFITANTATTIEVTGDVTSYTAGGDTYKIIDYHISFGSHCINAGDPNFVVDSNDVDLDDEPRVVGGRVEIGVDEAAAYMADLDFFFSHWLDYPCTGDAGNISDWCFGNDINKDEIVNFEDFAKIAENWLVVTP